MKAAPRFLVPNYTAKIRYRAPTGAPADNYVTWFDHWSDAHAFLAARSAQEVTKARDALHSAQRKLRRVRSMTAPAGDHK